MYALVGTFVEVYQKKIGEPFVHDEKEEIIALFSSKEKAQDYERRSRLVHRHRMNFSGDLVYRKSSLLRNCESAHIELYEEIEYPVDPEL